MDMVHLVRKAIFSIALVERDSFCLGGHDDKAVLFQYPGHISHVSALRNLNHHINDILGPYSLNGGASDMTDPDNRLIV